MSKEVSLLFRKFFKYLQQETDKIIFGYHLFLNGVSLNTDTENKLPHLELFKVPLFLIKMSYNINFLVSVELTFPVSHLLISDLEGLKTFFLCRRLCMKENTFSFLLSPVLVLGSPTSGLGVI